MHSIYKNSNLAARIVQQTVNVKYLELPQIISLPKRTLAHGCSISFTKNGQVSGIKKNLLLTNTILRSTSNSYACHSISRTSTRKLCDVSNVLKCSSHSNQYSSFSSFYSKFFSVNAAEVISDAEQTDISQTVVATTPVAAEKVPESFVDYIPLPPAPLPGGIDPNTLNGLGEPTMSSLGLGGWTPVGIFQNLLDLAHVHSGLPWWGTIALFTVCLRIAMFPLIVLSQRNAAVMNNMSPQMQVLQAKITDSRQSGDQLNAARYSQELAKFMKDNNCNPLKSMMVPLAQAPIFISVFMGLRGCANLPVMSMTAGGMLWFTDLTIADPYYLLPIITSLTMAATIELGTEAGRMNVSNDNTKIIYTALRFMPVVVFPFMMNFPAAVLCYWVSTNTCSLVQAGVLKVPAIRNYFNIPQIIAHNPENLVLTKKHQKKGTIQAAKDSWKNMKTVRELEDRQRYDEVRFAKAGTGPIVRTFKYDPTKAKSKSSNQPIDVNPKIK